VRRAWIILLVLAGCGSSQKFASTTPTALEAPADPSHAKIEQLAQQIDQQSAQMGLAPHGVAPRCPDCGAIATASVTLPWKTDPQCHPGQSETCTQSCTVSDSICENSRNICQLADELKPDTWAQNKCDASKETCAASHAKCCACSP
jgi:hypothetical protein